MVDEDARGGSQVYEFGYERRLSIIEGRLSVMEATFGNHAASQAADKHEVGDILKQMAADMAAMRRDSATESALLRQDMAVLKAQANASWGVLVKIGAMLLGAATFAATVVAIAKHFIGKV